MAIILAAGVVLCIVGLTLANSSGVDLFDNSLGEDGRHTVTETLGSTEISRISLILKDADFSIDGNSSENSALLVNFTKNSYEYSVSNRTVQIDNTQGILFTILNISDNGLNFDGLRHFMVMNSLDELDKRIDVRLKRAKNLSSYEMEVTDGDISLSNIDDEASYNINQNGGDTTISNITEAQDAEIIINNGSLKTSGSKFLKFSAEINGGDCSLALPSGCTVSLETTDGTLTIDGTESGKQYSGLYGEKTTEVNSESKVIERTVSVRVTGGNIDITRFENS